MFKAKLGYKKTTEFLTELYSHQYLKKSILQLQTCMTCPPKLTGGTLIRKAAKRPIVTLEHMLRTIARVRECVARRIFSTKCNKEFL